MSVFFDEVFLGQPVGVPSATQCFASGYLTSPTPETSISHASEAIKAHFKGLPLFYLSF